MKKFAMFTIPIALFVAGLILGALALDGQPSAQASIPAQVADSDGWSVQSFTNINFEPKKWEQLGQVGSCVVFSSKPGVGETATVTVRSQTEDFELTYAGVGARVTSCAGFTAFFPPKSSGRPPTSDDS